MSWTTVFESHHIATYPRENWGEDMARTHVLTLRKACEDVARFPELGSRSMVPGYRRLTVESHAVYYRVTIADAIIVRVLHEKQSPRRQFPREMGRK